MSVFVTQLQKAIQNNAITAGGEVAIRLESEEPDLKADVVAQLGNKRLFRNEYKIANLNATIDKEFFLGEPVDLYYVDKVAEWGHPERDTLLFGEEIHNKEETVGVVIGYNKPDEYSLSLYGPQPSLEQQEAIKSLCAHLHADPEYLLWAHEEKIQDQENITIPPPKSGFKKCMYEALVKTGMEFSIQHQEKNRVTYMDRARKDSVSWNYQHQFGIQRPVGLLREGVGLLELAEVDQFFRVAHDYELSVLDPISCLGFSAREEKPAYANQKRSFRTAHKTNQDARTNPGSSRSTPS